MSLLVLSGCNKEGDIPVSESSIPVHFTASKPGDSQTRASGTSWDSGDQIGVYAIKNQTTLQPENIIDNNDNLPFATNGSGLFYPQGKSIFYPQDGSLMDIVAYYPHKANLADYVYPIDIAEQSDFFYSNNLKGIGKNNTGGGNTLIFNRILSKLILNISPQTAGTSLNGLTVVASGSPTKAAFSLQTSILSLDENSVAEISLPVSGDNNRKQVSALLLPSSEGGRTEIRFSIAGNTYSWHIPHTMESGKVYSYDIKLDKITAEVRMESYMEIPLYTSADTAPNSIKALHMVSNPAWLNSSYTTTITGIRNYTVLFDTQNRIPFWVAYPMHPVYLASGNRTDAWDYDPLIPQNNQPELYSGWSTSGLDRGHLLASADRNASRELNKTTFYFTNMAPQNNSMNGGVWAILENKVRDWCKQTAYDTLYVVTGCILPTPPEEITYTNDNKGRPSAVPKYLYKALLRKKISDGTYTSIAFKMENAGTGVSYQNSVVSVKDIEETTGFTFFTHLPPDVAADVKQNTSLSEWK